jgi:TetR/AcrR family transcriptional regulator, regulator of cefoperazone and chloramphenicol sensitivity
MTLKQETRERILYEAIRLFAERGYHGVTVRELCDAAGANQAAVNYHFRSKFELYKEVLTTGFERLGEFRPVPRLSDNPDHPEKQLADWISWYLERILRTDDALTLSHIIAKELREPTEAFAMLIEQSVIPLFTILTEIVGAVLRREPSCQQVVLVSLGIISQCIFYIMSRPLLERMFPDRLHQILDYKELSRVISAMTLSGISALRDEKYA